MAAPAAKRRKIDSNHRQVNTGYNIGLFLDPKDANRYLCVICQYVFKQPHNIGCDNEHIFCKACLDNYFIPINAVKSCPSCREPELMKSNIKPSRFVERLVHSLQVKCPFEAQHDQHDDVQCVWSGDLDNLDQHINVVCPLGDVTCDHCNQHMKRYQLEQHENICDEKPVGCNQCGHEIKKKLLQRHQDTKCPMNMLSCDECKENILRKNLETHLLQFCCEYEIMCSFQPYGCNVRVKRTLMDQHLKEKETDHLKMKINSIENELKEAKQKHSVELEASNLTWNEYICAQKGRDIVNSKGLKECIISYINGHDMIYEDNRNNLFVNVLDMGMRILLKHKKIYKDIQFKEIYENWCEESGIEIENLMVYNYTERKNKTLRTNRQITLDLNEDHKKDDTDNYSSDEIDRHEIATTPVFKFVQSIYDRIGNIFQKKRMYIFFDKTKVTYLQGQDELDDAPNEMNQIILVALKYFDIFEQKLYFVDWLLVKRDTIRFKDVMKYVEMKLSVLTKDKRSYFDVLYNYVKDMNHWVTQTGSTCDRFVMFEEENTSLANTYTNKCKINKLSLNAVITNEYFHGDVFIFQLNGEHPYFNTLKTSKNEFKERGLNWYDNVSQFLESLSITIRNDQL